MTLTIWHICWLGSMVGNESEHDELFMYATDRPIGEEDVNKLVGMGWWQDEDFSYKYYLIGSGWKVLV